MNPFEEISKEEYEFFGAKAEENNALQIIKDFQKENSLKSDILKEEINNRKEDKESSGLENKEKNFESLELKLEGEKIYSDKFVGKLDEILNYEFTDENNEEKIILKETVDKYLKEFSAPEFSDLSTEKQAEIQKRFVQELTNQISKIPSDTWSIDFERSMKTGKLNCTSCASLNGLILKSTKKNTGLRDVEFGCPYGHAMNIVTFSDGRFYFVDPRNNIFEDLTDNAEIKERNGLKIYKVEQKNEIDYKIIPALSIQDGALNSYVDNLNSAYYLAKEGSDDVLEKTRTSDQLEKIRKEAEEICEEEDLFEEKHLCLEDIREIFGEKIDEYEESEEFQGEVKRLNETVDFRVDRKPESGVEKEKNEEKEIEKTRGELQDKIYEMAEELEKIKIKPEKWEEIPEDIKNIIKEIIDKWEDYTSLFEEFYPDAIKKIRKSAEDAGFKKALIMQEDCIFGVSPFLFPEKFVLFSERAAIKINELEKFAPEFCGVGLKLMLIHEREHFENPGMKAMEKIDKKIWREGKRDELGEAKVEMQTDVQGWVKISETEGIENIPKLIATKEVFRDVLSNGLAVLRPPYKSQVEILKEMYQFLKEDVIEKIAEEDEKIRKELLEKYMEFKYKN